MCKQEYINQMLINCDYIDNLGYELLRQLNIKPLPATFDRWRDYLNSVIYYRGFGLSPKHYQFHHTKDGYLVPVLKEQHQALKHYGGMYLHKLSQSA